MHIFTILIATLAFLTHCVLAENDRLGFFTEERLSWNGYGGGPANRHYAEANLIINSSNIQTIHENCRISYPNGVSAVPTTFRDQGMTYFPTWNGLFIALDYKSCQTKWSINVTEIIQKFAPINATDSAGSGPALVSRTSPQVSGDVLYFGTQARALIVAVDLNSGKTLDIAQVNPHPLAIVTMSPTVFHIANIDGAASKEVLFVGAASGEETAADFVPGYVCCSFVGNMIAVTFDYEAGFKKLWDIPMIPSDISGVGKWSGAAIWGSQPSIDLDTYDTVYIATGNTYAVPTAFDQCMNSTSSNSSSCLPSTVWQNSVIALDVRTGKPRWVHQIGPLDAWTIACGAYGSGKLMPPNCPQTPGPDADFGMAPSFVQAGSANIPYGKSSVLVIAQKNGNMYAIDPTNGDIIWAVAAGPGGADGGLSWGIAVDRNQVYYTAINSASTTWQLQPSNQTTNGSAYGAINLSNGKIAWETLADGTGQAYGPPSVVGDIVFNNKPYVTQGFSAIVGPGGLVVLSSTTGEILLEKEIDAPFHGGVAVQDNYLIFGTGYGGYISNGSIYVMCVD